MRLIYQLVNNYGVAIVLFTIITKILLFPISYKQQKNTLRMQLIQPKLKKLQAKYKDKPQELQQAQMQLYQEEHVNPMSSCLPMFLQFFLLFGVLDVVYKPLTHILHYSKSVISRVVEISTGILGDSVAKQYTGLRQELGVLKAFQDNPSAFSNVDTFDTSKVSDFMEHFTVFGLNLGEYLRSHSVLYSAALRYFTADYDHLYADYAEEAGYSTRTEHGLHERHAVCNAAVLCLVCLSGICRCWFLLGLFVLLLAVADHRSESLLYTGTGCKDH